MTHRLAEFGVGLLLGGLGVSACWGLFWLSIGMVGLSRGSCRWRVVRNSLMATLLPLSLMAGLLWLYDGVHGVSGTLAMGLLGMPMILVGFGLRPAPDGQRAGQHMLQGVHHLMDQLLGKHQHCGGCSHDEEHRGGCG